MLTFNNITLSRGKKELFSDVSFIVNPKSKVGLTGANGCGKTSLIKLILGELHADSGEFSISDKLLISHVAQEISNTNRSAIEYVIDGDNEFREIEEKIQQAQDCNDPNKLALLYDSMQQIDGYTANSRAAKLLNGLGFATSDEQKPVNSFSGGWRMRLNLAQALMCRSDILLLDEPTNHLDLEAIIWLEEWLKHYAGIILLISHDRDFLNAVCSQIINIEHGKATLYQGNYDSFERIRAEKMSLQQSMFESQQKQIKHMQSYIDRFRYKASKAKQAQSRVKALEKMELISAAQIDSPFNFNFSNEGFIPQQLLKITEASTGYAEKEILKNINLLIQKGEKIGLIGFNGAGKSTLIKLIAKEINIFRGEIDYAKELRIGYFAQHQLDQLHFNLSPIEHLKLIDKNISEQQARNYLGGFAFHNDMATDNVQHFSGGEKARLVLALLVYQKPNLLLLDEPTNHLDIRMRHAISVALQSYEGAMILVSHDRYLLSTVTDKLLLVANGEVQTFDGDLQDYYRWANDTRKNAVQTEENVEGEVNSQNNKKLQRQQAAELRELQKPLRQKLRKIEMELEKLQKHEHQNNEKLMDESLYETQNTTKLKDITITQSEVKKRIVELETSWLEISEQLESSSL
ncbi:MAG: ATP-binding cassette domain-containing protein [Xanthomonadales bacterium]|nr:ATP-binding cassette domain-containing protein [Xanthomonadales bacterium]MCB1594235.1 ATP-binding cassette domain-containing protein [Xanthomonadales bacterium]